MGEELKPESKLFILRKEFPSIDAQGFDSDLALYYKLLKKGDKKQALEIYQTGLETKYPREEKRVELIRLYRTNDSRFSAAYASAINDLLKRLLKEISADIDNVIKAFDGARSDPMTLLQKVQKVLQKHFTGKEQKAVDMIDRLTSYSKIMGYRSKEFVEIAALLKEYLDNSLFDSIDMKKIRFTKKELEEIQIDGDAQTKPKQVLAFCRHYWYKVQDTDFERRLLLYSKKYGSVHYDVYKSIQNGRLGKAGDEVILLEVLSVISPDYSYNANDDLFMKKAWEKMKPSTPVRKKKAAPSTQKTAQSQASSKTAAPKSTKKPRPQAKPTKPQKQQLQPKPSQTPPKQTKPQKPQIRKEPQPKPQQKPVKQSLSRQVEQLNGGLFKNYHRLFRTKLVNFVEEYLIRDTVSGTDKGLDEEKLEEAKNIIYRFITDNYDNPEYEWMESEERKQVEALGFFVSETYTITSRCYNFVKDASLREEYKRMARR